MMRLLLPVLALLVLGGCSWFGGKEEVIKPAELRPISEEVELDTIWDRKVGGDANDRGSKLVPAIAGSRVFAAAADGKVVAIESGSGRLIWEVDIREVYSDAEARTAFAKKSDAITGGVGIGSDVLVVGTFAGELVALNQSDGSLAWRARTTSEVLAPPVVHRDMVVAQSIDGKVAAFDVLDGERRWVYTATIPSLTLRGTSTPLVTESFVIAGFANGRISVLDRERGFAGVDRRIAVAQGKSDLERLVDIDGPMVMTGNQLFVVSYQGTLLALDLTNGTVRWGIDASSTAGLSVGFGNVYVSHADGKVAAYDQNSGREVWTQDALSYRELTTPVPISSYIAVGDLEGYIHLIAQSDGRFVGRRKVASGHLTTTGVVDGSRLYVQTLNGRLQAFELK